MTIKQQYSMAYWLARMYYSNFKLGLYVDRAKMHAKHCTIRGIPNSVALAAWNSIPIQGLTLRESLRNAAMDRLQAKYESELMDGFNWREIITEAKNNPIESYDSGSAYGACYLGSVLSLSPSGKYYTPWAHSNITEASAMVDQAWYDALDSVAESFGGWIESGEGDPTDLYFAIALD